MATTFRQDKPRIESELLCQCFAKPVLFLKWDEMPADAKNEFSVNGPIPCEDGGVPGSWCHGCRFGVVSEPDII